MGLSHNPQRRRQQLAIRIGLVLCVLLLWRWVSSRDDSALDRAQEPVKGELAKDRIDSFADSQIDGGDGDKRKNNNNKDKDGGRESQDEGDKKGVVDWADRRERVKDAFLVSWEAYAQDAWG